MTSGRLNSYSNAVTSTPSTDIEKSELAFNKIGIPKGKLSFIDDLQFRRVDLYVKCSKVSAKSNYSL